MALQLFRFLRGAEKFLLIPKLKRKSTVIFFPSAQSSKYIGLTFIILICLQSWLILFSHHGEGHHHGLDGVTVILDFCLAFSSTFWFSTSAAGFALKTNPVICRKGFYIGEPFTYFLTLCNPGDSWEGEAATYIMETGKCFNQGSLIPPELTVKGPTLY